MPQTCAPSDSTLYTLHTTLRHRAVPTPGKRRKDLVARATALLTDGIHQDMTLQLWGDLASEETISRLRAGVVAANGEGTTPTRVGLIRTPAVFEFTRLRPEFSFLCEALVLNGKNSSIRTLPRDSPDAISISRAVVAAAVMSEETHDKRGAEGPAVAGTAERSRTEALSPAESGPASARTFESVAALMSADGFSGAGCLSGVVVRKVDAPCLAVPAALPPGFDSPINRTTTAVTAVAPASRGVPLVSVYLGDPEGLRYPTDAGRSVGVEAVLHVAVDGGALRDLLGCVSEEVLMLARGTIASRGSESCDGGLRVMKVARTLLDGLEVGGEEGERVDVMLACSASVDGNGRVTPGGSSYRLISLHPSHISGGSDPYL